MKTRLELPAKDRILQTAHELFYRDGIRATGIDRIIEQAHVTKVTFYRHFPSKSDLVIAYLEYRHQIWMNWFQAALASAPKSPGFALSPVIQALKEWFNADGFRGCAFINGVVELDAAEARVSDLSLRHKQDMLDAIATLLPKGKNRSRVAQAAAMAVDGAIIRMQMEKNPEAALTVLETILRALCVI